jgi:hypothetical protein
MSRSERLVAGLALGQALDAVANELAPRSYIDTHLDHLGVPGWLRPAFPAIKTSSTAGLLIGLKWRRVGAVTAGALVAYYAAAVGFHVLTGDPVILTAPAAALGAGAAVALLVFTAEGTARSIG